jgi:hypothetical protein
MNAASDAHEVRWGAKSPASGSLWRATRGRDVERGPAGTIVRVAAVAQAEAEAHVDEVGAGVPAAWRSSGTRRTRRARCPKGSGAAPSGE